MPAFIRRFTQFPTIETITEIESLDIVDTPPPAPTAGVNTGTVIQVGEFEDGPFAAGGDADLWDGEAKGTGPQAVVSPEDVRQRYGDFGFQYGGVSYENPCARRHLSELWNGNAFIYRKFVQPQSTILARVDTSVGEVAFNRLACIEGSAGPFNLEPSDSLTITTDVGGPAVSDAIAAAVATRAGAAGTFPTGFVGGEQMSVAIDGGPAVTVTFSAADQSAAQVVSRINTFLGFTSAVENLGEVDISGIRRGMAGSVTLVDVTVGTLAVIGHSAGTTNGTGNVDNVDAVTVAEIVTIINGTAALNAIDVSAQATQDGRIRICSDTSASGTILIAPGTMASELELDPLNEIVTAGIHSGGTIPAGTRVRTVGNDEWVTMQTLTVPAGISSSLQGGPFIVKVRPALDDGTAAGTAAGTVTVVVDNPSFGALSVNNVSALSAARTEPQMDVAYEDAVDATVNVNTIVREASYIVSARQSDALRAKLRTNALTASAEGSFGRKAIVSAPLGFSQAQATTQVGTLRSDRVFYTWPGWRVRIPEIASRGTAGGLGFTENGIITVRAEHTLAYVDSYLAPEENPGQQTNLLLNFFEVEPQPSPLGIQAYTQLKAAGICAPRLDRVAGAIFQSGITSVDPVNNPGLVTQARRKIADFIQDTLAERLLPFSKKLNTAARRAAARSVVDEFLLGLQSPDNPSVSRIEAFSVDEESGNTPATLAQGIFVMIIKVRNFSSLDNIVLQTEIGEGVVIVQEAA